MNTIFAIAHILTIASSIFLAGCCISRSSDDLRDNRVSDDIEIKAGSAILCLFVGSFGLNIFYFVAKESSFAVFVNIVSFIPQLIVIAILGIISYRCTRRSDIKGDICTTFLLLIFLSVPILSVVEIVRLL